MAKMSIATKLRHTALLAWLMFKGVALYALMTLLALVMIWKV